MKSESDEKLWNYFQKDNPAYLDTTSRDKSMLLAKLIRRNTSPGDHLCEVGLGSGLLLQELARHRRIVGVDLCDGTIAQLRSKPGLADLELRQGNICELSSVYRDMDAIISIDVIEHLTQEQLDQACHEVFMSLNPGGKWFINVPWNENLQMNEVFCPHCYRSFHRVGHKQSFDESRLKAVMAQANFKSVFIKRIYTANFCLPAPLMWMYRIIARIYLKTYASMFAMFVKG
jgi:cyclopropane fatty-acyl-phospholipid synthase-like methyltransferase